MSLVLVRAAAGPVCAGVRRCAPVCAGVLPAQRTVVVNNVSIS